MAMSPWRKLETGEVIYYPWISKSSAYLADFDVARKIQIFNELLMTIGFPIFINATIAGSLDKSMFAHLLIVVGAMLLIYFVDLIFRLYIIRNLAKFDIGKLSPGNKITKVFPTTNPSRPISSTFRIMIGIGLSFFVFDPISPKIFIIALVLFLALMVYNIKEAIKIRVEDWSPDPVLR